MSLADTNVAIPGGTALLSSLTANQPVLAGSVSGNGLTWSPQAVAFEQGDVPGGPQPEMIFIRVSGSDDPLIVSPDQPFLMPDGTLKRALTLTVTDLLVLQSGASVAIEAISVGSYARPIYNIAIGSMT